MSEVQLKKQDQSLTATPNAGYMSIFTNASGVFQKKDENGVVTDLQTSLSPSKRSVTANTTVLTTDDIIFCNAGSAITVTLPSSATYTKILSVKVIQSTAVTITAASGDTIESASPLVISRAGTSVNLVSFSNTWYIV